MPARQFSPGSFYDNIDAAVRALGFRQPGIIWALAQVPWESITDRNSFLDELVTRDYFDVTNQNQGGV